MQSCRAHLQCRVQQRKRDHYSDALLLDPGFVPRRRRASKRRERGMIALQLRAAMARQIRVTADDNMLPRQRTSVGALLLIALGALLLAHNALPPGLHHSPLHAALILGSLAAGFGALYAFDAVGRRWARLPAMFFGTVAAVALFAAWPWHWFAFGFGAPFWALVLIVVGVWLMRRDRRWA
jgi:hypothetical protein